MIRRYTVQKIKYAYHTRTFRSTVTAIMLLTDWLPYTKMTTKNHSVRYTYAKITYVKIRMYVSKIKYAPYVRIQL